MGGMWEASVRHLCSGEQKLSPMKIQGADTSVKFLGLQR